MLFCNRHTLITLIINILIFSSCKKSADINFEVNGKLENLAEKEIYAVKNFSLDSISIDTIKPSDGGVFKLIGFIENPTLVTLFYTDKFPPLRFFIDKNYSVQIKGNAQDPLSIEVKGGLINNDLNNFRRENNNLLMSRFRILDKDTPADPAFLKNVDFQLSRIVREYVEKNPTKLSSVVLMDEFSKGTLSPELLNQDIKLLEGPAADYYLTTSLKDYNDKALASSIGADAPQIELKDTKGKSVKLTDFKNKSVLLIFDLKDAPQNGIYFNKLKDTQKLLSKKIDFISIVVDEDSEKPDPKTIKIANSLDWTVLLDSKKWNSKEVIKYNITTLPYMILISPEGKILERGVSLDSLVSTFDKFVDLKKIN